MSRSSVDWRGETEKLGCCLCNVLGWKASPWTEGPLYIRERRHSTDDLECGKAQVESWEIECTFGQMEQPVRRYSPHVAGSSNRSSPSYSTGPSSSFQRKSLLPQPRSVPDLLGRARKKAELNRVNQEIRLLQEELQRLETLPPASEACRLLVRSIESQSEPFLANSIPSSQWDPQWDRWFRGPPEPRSTCCCIPTAYDLSTSFVPALFKQCIQNP